MTSNIRARDALGVRRSAMKRVRWCVPPITNADRKQVGEALKKRMLTNGGRVREFEERFGEWCGGGEAVAVSSCMAALHLAALVLGLQPGDEVIVPALTHVATANAPVLAGCRPVFVDVHPSSGNLDNNLIEAAITHRTRAVFLQHHVGLPAYMGSTLDIARRHGLRVVEDCATALGATHSGKHVGLLGDVGCFSFHPKKQLTTGEGGMFLTKHAELADKARRLRSFGYGEDAYGGICGPGLNYRMTEFQAVLGTCQLARMGKMLAARHANMMHLKHSLGHLEHFCSPYGFTFFVPPPHSRASVRHSLTVAGIETSIHYPAPIPDLDWYRENHPQPGPWPHARRLSAETITLPVGPHLTSVHVNLAASAVLAALQERKAA